MLRRLTCALLATAALAGPISACAATPTKVVTAAKPAPDAAVLAAAAPVADWQLAHMDNFDYVPVSQFGATPKPRATGSRRRSTSAWRPMPTPPSSPNTPRPSSRMARRRAGASTSVLATPTPTRPARCGSGRPPAPTTPPSWSLTRARFDAILADPSHVDLGFDAEAPQGGDPCCQARWCWSDAIFMAPPAWIALTKETKDPRYLAHADSEFWATTDLLYDKTEHLYFRDSRFITRRSDAGAKIFWGRGNGWAFAGVARILQDLPKDHPSRPRYEALFKQMAAKIVTLQGEQGYWPVSLLEPQKTPETSGTGFFVYGLAWGVNHGLLPAAQYRPAIDKGWTALTAAIEPDGKLGWVQRVGAAPDQVGPDDTQLYGVGAFLLSASEVSRLPPTPKR